MSGQYNFDYYGGYERPQTDLFGGMQYRAPQAPKPPPKDPDLNTEVDKGTFATPFLKDLQTGFGAAGSIMGAYNGYQQVGLAKDQFNMNKQYAATNLQNQANLINEQLRNKQWNRLQSQGIENPSEEALNAYVAQHGAKGKV